MLKKDHFSGFRNIFGGGAKGLAAILNGKLDKEALDTVTPIADPATATAEDVAEKFNELLAALKE